jgi:hypothetical protein
MYGQQENFNRHQDNVQPLMNGPDFFQGSTVRLLCIYP